MAPPARRAGPALASALVGTLVPYFVIGACQLAFLFGLGALGVRHAGRRQRRSALVVLSLAVVLCAVCLGLLIASFGGTEKQIGGDRLRSCCS